MSCESISEVQSCTEAVISSGDTTDFMLASELQVATSASPSLEKPQFTNLPSPPASSDTIITSSATPFHNSDSSPLLQSSTNPFTIQNKSPSPSETDSLKIVSPLIASSESTATSILQNAVSASSSTFTPILPAPVTSPASLSNLSSSSHPSPPTVAHPIPSLPLTANDLKFVSTSPSSKTVLMLPSTTPATAGGVNGLGSKIVQVSGGSNSSSSIAYLGTLIKKGKETTAQKVVLTPVRGKDGAITRLILPKSRATDGQAMGSSTSPAQAPCIGGRFILPKGKAGVAPKSFVVQSSMRSGAAAAPVRPLPPPSAPVRHLADTLPQAKPFPSSDVAIATILPATDVDAGKKKLTSSIINGKIGNIIEQARSQAKHGIICTRPRSLDSVKDAKDVTVPSTGSQDNIIMVDLEGPENNPTSQEVDSNKNADGTTSQTNPDGSQISNTLHIPDQPVRAPQFLLPLLQMPGEGKSLKQASAEKQANKKKQNIMSQYAVQLPSGLHAYIQVYSPSNPAGQGEMADQADQANLPGDASDPISLELSNEFSEAPADSLQESCKSQLPFESQTECRLSPPVKDVPMVTLPEKGPTPSGLSNIAVAVLSQNKSNGNQMKPRILGQHPVLSVGGRVSDDRRKRKHLPVSKEGKKTIAVKRLEPLPGAVNVDPLQIIQWDNETSMGTLPGSHIKFVMNCFGGLQVFDVNGTGDSAFSRLSAPSESKEEKDEICRCIQCHCYGLVAEFVDKKYCSTLCRDEFLTTKAFVRKRELILDNSGSPCLLLTATKRKLLEKALGQSSAAQMAAANESPPSSPAAPEPPTTPPLPPPPQLEKIPPQVTKLSQTAKALSEEKAPPPVSPAKSPTPPPQPSPPPSPGPSTIKEEPADTCVPSPPTLTAIFPVKSEEIDEFDWHSYLEKTNSSAAWVRLFPEPFPSLPNIFIPGQRLEAFDPINCSAVCVASVAQVNGHRLRIHFDGYGSESDVWVNADSPDIMPCGWASSVGVRLSVPPGWDQETFTWSKYLATVTNGPVPNQAFTPVVQNGVNLFEVGMKIEAVDRKNRSLVCVASVAAVIGPRIRVHFDSWDDHYDYWCDSSSPLIRPVGWCKANRITLTPPNRWNKPFSWQRYLSNTNSRAAPSAAFTPRPPILWRRGTKLEAVDPRAPAYVSVATVMQVLPYQVRIAFDGMPHHYGWWFDDDSSDLHPVGWCQRTGTQLVHPPNNTSVLATRCPTGACNGRGNYTDRSQANHFSIEECPYTPDRVDSVSLPMKSAAPKPNSSECESTEEAPTEEMVTEEIPVCVEPSRTATVDASPAPSSKNINKSTSPISITEEFKDFPAMTAEINSPVKMDCYDADSPSPCENVVDVMAWDSARVTRLVETAVGAVTKEWMCQCIDGEAFLMLVERDLTKILNFSSKDASLIMNLVTSYQSKFISV